MYQNNNKFTNSKSLLVLKSRFGVRRDLASPVMVRKAENNEPTLGPTEHVEALANPDTFVHGRSWPRIYYR
jgi:hypothetical protein